MNRNRILSVLISLCFLASLPARAADGDNAPDVLHGPAEAALKDIAALEVPAGFIFFDGDQTRSMMRSYGEPVSGQEVGMLVPTNADWSVFFDFADVGYVKDDDKDELDPAELLTSIKAGNDAGNKQRKRNGVPPLNLIGWEQEPHYDQTTHNLTWAIRFESEGQPLLNYNTRLLGRKGYMSVILVVGPDELAGTLPEFRNLLAGYDYQSGQNYAEYRSGDKVAKYGLAALVVGGAAVGAAKMGLLGGLLVFLKKGWKFIVAGLAVVGAWLRKLFLRKTDGPQH